MGIIEDIAALFSRLRSAEKGIQTTWDYAVSILERTESKFGELYGRLMNIEKAQADLSGAVKQLSGLDVQGFIGKAVDELKRWISGEVNDIWAEMGHLVNSLEKSLLTINTGITDLSNRLYKIEATLAEFSVHVFDGLASYISTNVEAIGQSLRSVEIPSSWNPASEPHQKIRAQLVEYRKNWR